MREIRVGPFAVTRFDERGVEYPVIFTKAWHILFILYLLLTFWKREGGANIHGEIYSNLKRAWINLKVFLYRHYKIGIE